MQIEQQIIQLFPNFSDNAKVWIYQSNRVFSEQEVNELQMKVAAFVDAWAAHGKKVQAEGKVLFNRFIIFVADESLVQVSGCSIDSSVQFIKHLQQQYQVDFFDRFYSVFYINDNLIGMNKAEFKKYFTENNVVAETKVFNNTINTLKELKTRWFIQLNESWQAKLILQTVNV